MFGKVSAGLFDMMQNLWTSDGASSGPETRAQDAGAGGCFAIA